MEKLNYADTKNIWRTIYPGIENIQLVGKKRHIEYLISLRIFLDYIQRAMYPEAPELPSVCLLFKEDIPRKPQKPENDIKYIPERVLQQLEDNLEHLTPSEYIPIVFY
ncbi:hypothetical protein TheetDRAFT_2567 [Thermoanaerobacter ethanolicus JW 200]|nr:hypothetical protein TheetDRAFT_2567 [Thermoanaerobacter ethanolicus JW 200]